MLAIGRSTHSGNVALCLAARALGASEVTIIGKKDQALLKYIGAVNTNWGGKFKVSFAKSYKGVIESSEKYIKIYLTRYGEPLQNRSEMIRTYKNIILIITHKENEEYINQVSDFKISITSQPYSSIAAIAVFLHEYYKGRELAMHFENAKYKISSANGSNISVRKV